MCTCVCVHLCGLLFLGFTGAGLTSGSTRSAPDITAPLLSSFPLLRLSATALFIRSKRWNFYIGQTAFFYNLTQYEEEQERIAKAIARRCIKCLIKGPYCHCGFNSIQVFRAEGWAWMCVCLQEGRTHQEGQYPGSCAPGLNHKMFPLQNVRWYLRKTWSLVSVSF